MADEIGNQLATLILRKECELEMMLNTSKTQKEKLKKVQTLVGTYSQAIEYYQSIDSDLYIDLNLRMQQLLIKPEILELLDNEAEIISQAAAKTKSTEVVLSHHKSAPVSSPSATENEIKDHQGDNRNSESPKTRDSSILFDAFVEHTFWGDENNEGSGGSRATFHLTDPRSLDGEPKEDKLTSKTIAKFKVEDHSTEFVYHKDDKRNRHGVSFKVLKNREDGALLRPKLPKNKDKKEIHSTMLNENNDNLCSKPRINATQKVMTEYKLQQDDETNLSVVLCNMYEQESSLKIRLLKRENKMNRRRREGDNSFMNISGSSGSPNKTRTFSEITF